MVLAATAYGRSELIWYFRHVNELLQTGPAGKLALGALGQQPESKVLVPEDPAVMQLLSALVTVEDSLVSAIHVILIALISLVAGSGKFYCTFLGLSYHGQGGTVVHEDCLGYTPHARSQENKKWSAFGTRTTMCSSYCFCVTG
jgi:hypothetical protein